MLVNIFLAYCSAISEFAPENKLYATGHRIEVEKIDMSISKIEDWRFCPSCSHLENVKETGDIFKECPNCGDPQWADIGQIMKLVRLRQVMDRSSRIGDDAEDRGPVFYTRHYILLEHKSYGDPWVALQILEYMVNAGKPHASNILIN